MKCAVNYVLISVICFCSGCLMSHHTPDWFAELDKGSDKNVLRSVLKFVDLDERDNLGRSGLHISVLNTNLDAADVVISMGLNVDVKDNNGETPLMYSVKYDNVEMFDFLLSRGASIDSVDADGFSALAYSVIGKKDKWVERLLRHGANPNIIVETLPISCHAFITEQYEMLKILIKYGADISTIPSGQEYTLFDLIIWECDEEIVKLAIDSLVTGQRDNVLGSALVVSVLSGREDIVTLLIESGADVNYENSFGVTPLIAVVSTGDKKIVRLLLDKGGDPVKMTSNGDTALFCAAKGTNDYMKAVISEKVLEGSGKGVTQ